jgi:hypothetical protein
MHERCTRRFGQWSSTIEFEFHSPNKPKAYLLFKQAGGLSAISRWLSEAIPPDSDYEFDDCIPAGMPE